MSNAQEFSVYWWDPVGNCNTEAQWIGAEEAVKLAHAMTLRPATTIGAMRRIIITDGGDHTVFEWKYGEGVTWPKPGKPLRRRR